MVTLVFVSASPYHLKYLYDYDGVGTSQVNKTQAVLVADLAAGGPLGQTPLRDLLNSITVDATWNAVAGRGDLSLYSTIVSLPMAGTAIAADFNSVAGRNLRVRGVDGNAGLSALIEIKYRPQLQRSQGPT